VRLALLPRFATHPRANCPSCQSAAPMRHCNFRKSEASSSRLVPSWRGVSRSSRTLGAGCGGREGAGDVQHLSWTAKSCGPGAHMQALSSRKAPKALRRRRWQTRVHRGERDISRKTTAQGRPVVTACTCGFRARATRFCARAPGACGHPVFPAPSAFGPRVQQRVQDAQSSGACAARTRGRAYRRSDELSAKIKLSGCPGCRA
jgi:hypothetical protein